MTWDGFSFFKGNSSPVELSKKLIELILDTRHMSRIVKNGGDVSDDFTCQTANALVWSPGSSDWKRNSPQSVLGEVGESVRIKDQGFTGKCEMAAAPTFRSFVLGGGSISKSCIHSLGFHLYVRWRNHPFFPFFSLAAGLSLINGLAPSNIWPS